MLRTRIRTALIALPTTIAIILWAPANVFTGVILLLAAWGLYEIIAMTKARAHDALSIAVIGGVSALMSLTDDPRHWGSPALAAAFMLRLVARVAREGAEQIERNWWWRFIGALWIGWFFPYFALLRNSAGGIAIIILMLVLVVACDSGAYFVGQSIGRVKLMPRVSPNKTVEGAIGGLAACVIAGVILRPLLVPQWSYRAIVLMAAAVGILAQLGDLAGSAYKRVAGVKDSGWIFPGHGGLLDRTCSLVFAAGFTYYYSR